MVKSDFKRFSEMMLATAEAVDRDLSAAKIAVYFEDLKNFDIRALEWAAQAHRRKSSFFPRVAELRDLALTWKPPALPGGKGAETKLLESAEDREKKKQDDIRRLRGIIDSIGGLDAKYGTGIKSKSDFEKRIAELERQKRVILKREES